ncbi:MAG: DUF3305 domain-containing protein [Betaproteobacteria bacterium]|jgi:hypothetical protein|nr:DUF3305 domain-containing protein [Betaproteobacteria bacterium]
MARMETTTDTDRWAAAVVMERQTLDNRWASEKWEAKAVIPDLTPGATPRVVIDTPQIKQILVSGLVLQLKRDEAEGYYMNLTSDQPKVFVLWRMGEEIAEPQMLTASYNEGARWLDNEENVDGVPLPVELVSWIAAFSDRHYQPEPRKKVKYATNKDKGRMGNWRPD